MNELIEKFSAETGIPVEEIQSRWKGRPDRVIEDLFQFPDDDGDLHPVRLFKPYQHNFVHAYFYGDASTISFVKGRRIGGTAIALLCMALEGLMRPGSIYPLVSTKEDQAYKRIEDVRNIFKHSVLDVPIDVDNKGQIVLWNGTKYEAFTGKPEGARGDGARSVLFDEMAFMENQEEMLKAFKPMLSLSTGKFLQVSTVNSPNDRFMKSFQRGTPTGFDEDGRKVGTISIFQPTFLNHEEIDIEVSLYDQRTVPARPDLNLDVVEDSRLEDPMDFAQEYLCRPAAEQYRFFDKESVFESMSRSHPETYTTGEFVTAQEGGEMFMFVDIGHEHDDTVMSVFEHVGDRRYQRYVEAITDDVLAEMGYMEPDRRNINQVASRITDVFHQMRCDYLMVDKTGGGATFPVVLEENIGRGVIGFNFSDLKSVHKSMGSMNAALRNGRVTLIDHDRLRDHLLSITRVQTNDHTTPRFSGKDYSQDGKDDYAIATVMSAFPPGFDYAPARDAATKTREHPHIPRPGADDPSLASQRPRAGPAQRGPSQDSAFSSTTASRNRSRHSRRSRYRSRYSR